MLRELSSLQTNLVFDLLNRLFVVYLLSHPIEDVHQSLHGSHGLVIDQLALDVSKQRLHALLLLFIKRLPSHLFRPIDRKDKCVDHRVSLVVVLSHNLGILGDALVVELALFFLAF